MIGGVDAENTASIKMHTKLGFSVSSRVSGVGAKFGRWLDLVFVQKRLDNTAAPPCTLTIVVREALPKLVEMPLFVERALELMARTDTACAPRPGGISMLQHICQLRDMDRERYQLCLQPLLSDQAPAVPRWSDAPFASPRSYDAEDPKKALEAFCISRHALIGQLATLTDVQVEFNGSSRAHTLTVHSLIDKMLRHDAEHQIAIATLLTASKAERSGVP